MPAWGWWVVQVVATRRATKSHGEPHGIAEGVVALADAFGHLEGGDDGGFRDWPVNKVGTLPQERHGDVRKSSN